MKYNELKELLEYLPAILEKHGENTCYELLTSIINKYVEERKNFSKEQDLKEINEFQSIILPYIHQSEFGHYVLERPRGYIGDFVTQEMIWFARTNGRENKYRGITETGKIINYLTMEMENPKANEERIYTLRDIIKKGGKRIASLGCGSAIELWNIEDNTQDNKEILLLDQDNGALVEAKKHLESKQGLSIDYCNENIVKFVLRKDNKYLRAFDLVYVFGLCDYFNLKNSKRIVEGVWDMVDSGGLLVVTNAHPNNPTRFWMEYGGNWYLEYKTEDEMVSLASGLKDVEDIQLTLDIYKVFQYLEIRKK